MKNKIIMSIICCLLTSVTLTDYHATTNNCIDYTLSTTNEVVLESDQIQFNLEFSVSNNQCEPTDLYSQAEAVNFTQLVESGSDIEYSVDTDLIDVVVSDSGIVTLTTNDLSTEDQTLIDFGGNIVFTITAKDVPITEEVVVTDTTGNVINLAINDGDKYPCLSTSMISNLEYAKVGDTVEYQVLINGRGNHIHDFTGVDTYPSTMAFNPSSFTAIDDTTGEDMTDYFTIDYTNPTKLVIENTKSIDQPIMLRYEMEVTGDSESYKNDFAANYGHDNTDLVTDTIYYDRDSDSWVTFEHGNIVISSIDQSSSAIPNSEFDILDSSGEVVEHLVTNKDGTATSSNLGLGSYTVVQTAVPSGYELNEDVSKIEVIATDDDMLFEVVVKNEQETEIKPVEPPVEPETTDENDYLQVHLATPSGYALRGVNFSIYDQDGNFIEEITTDSNGNATSSILPPGKYYVVQTSAIAGYDKDDTKYWFEIGNNNQMIDYQVKNKPISGNVAVTNLTADGLAVADKEFSIYKQDGTYVQKIITDENGYGRSGALEYGNYYLLATDAPKQQFEFKIENQGDLINLTITDANDQVISDVTETTAAQVEAESEVTLAATGSNLVYISLLVLTLSGLLKFSFMLKIFDIK